MFPRVLNNHQGFTLLEVLITIVVIAISATALLGVFSAVVSRSADPMIEQQAIAIAEAYMEEIQLKSFEDPQGGETNGSEEGANRAQFDDVQDYNDASVDGAVEDQNGNPIAQLAAYTVTVTVGFEDLDTITDGINSLRIDISVNHPAIDPINLSGFRTNY
ncbi:MAG: prepilin-type N-terminal cleavage/methylation domain-containing protein [Gammaproteobacteria bacterium]|nr:prepilin-type N-terminal cleavage/methylation domain-containing protein [Gammaproteobacteria bacterium]